MFEIYDLRRLMMSCMILVGSAFWSVSSQAQYKSHMLQIPSIGYMGFQTMDRLVHRHYLEAPISDGQGGTIAPGTYWGASDQLTIGTGYGYGFGYHTWFDFQIAMGIGSAAYTQNFRPLVSLNTSLGLRHNFLDERWRPFISGHFHWLYMLNAEGTAVRPMFDGSQQSMWFGLRTGLGLEWFFVESMRKAGFDIDLFYDEMAFVFEVNGAVFADLYALPLFSTIARFGFNVYF
jgi:hypothetical protein